VTERSDGFPEASFITLSIPAGIKGRPYVCWSKDRTGAADPKQTSPDLHQGDPFAHG
jgi:hypothetical protein